MERGLTGRRTQPVGEKIGGVVISDRTVGSDVDPSVRSLVVVVVEVLEGLLQSVCRLVATEVEAALVASEERRGELGFVVVAPVGLIAARQIVGPWQ